MKEETAENATRRVFLATLLCQGPRHLDDRVPAGGPSRVSPAVKKMKRIQLAPVLSGPKPRRSSG